MGISADLNNRPGVSSGIGDPFPERFDVIVLGAGISGLVSASVMLGQGARRVLIADSYERLGGNHINAALDGYTFDVGSFVFQDDSPLLRHFPELLPLYISIVPTFGRIVNDGRVLDYPLSVRDDFVKAGPLELVRIFSSLAGCRLRHKPLLTAEDYAVYWMGQYFYDKSNLAHYVHRMFGSPASQLSLKFAEQRMGWIREHANLVGRLRRLWPQPVSPVNKQLVRPMEGFDQLYQVARARLVERGATFSLGRPLQSIRRNDDHFSVQIAGMTATADRVVSTVPLQVAERLCGLPTTDLPSVTMISLYFSFAGRRGFRQSILYNFTATGAWKRLTVHSDFYGRVNGREYFSVEVIGGWLGDNLSAAETDFRQHVFARDLFLGDLRLEGSHRLEHAYPIFGLDSEVRVDDAVKRIAKFGLTTLGRQGAFRYQPTARASTIEAEAELAPTTVGERHS